MTGGAGVVDQFAGGLWVGVASKALMRMKRRALLMGAVGFVAAAGCRGRAGRQGGERSMTEARRVVSLTPNTTEAVFALGAGGRLVGRSRYCDYPPEAAKVAAVGGYVDPSMEAILSVDPDLVVGARGPMGRSLVDTLQGRGITCYFPPTETLEQVFAMLLGLAGYVGARERGQALVGKIKADLARIERAYAGQGKVRVLLVFGQSPIVVAGPGSFPNEMLTLAGCENAVVSGTAYPALSFETLLALSPDVVVDASMAGGRNNVAIGVDRAGWDQLAAVKEGRVVRIDDERILRAGPRIAEGVQVLAEQVRRVGKGREF